jgi:hypothetical protein
MPVNEEKIVVYTPPGYDPRAPKPYPVLYLLHGWSGVLLDTKGMGAEVVGVGLKPIAAR